MGKKIQDFNRFYWILRYYVDFWVRLSYRNVIYEGKEKIPTDGAIIYAPNHTNTLMDAMVILAMDTKPKVFVARADIFKNPTLAKIFTFLKIMPIMRQRDGFNEVKKNQETIEKSIDVLKDKIPFCIFPEGTHQTKYSSLALSKGIFRIAFQAQEIMPQTPLYIIPTGIVYGDFFRYRSSLRVKIAEPINVGEFIKKHSSLSQQEQMNKMKDLLTERIHSSILYIPNDENYNATYEICNIVKDKTNKIPKYISDLKENNPQKAKELLELGEKAYKLREEKHICIDSVFKKQSIFKVLLTILTLPYSLCVSILYLPIVLACKYVFTLLKDPAFKNSVRFLLNLLLWTLLMIVYSIISFSTLNWQFALAVILLILPSPIVAHEFTRTIRLFVSDVKLRNTKQLKKLHSKIKEIVRG